MSTSSIAHRQNGISRVKLFLALSRTTHGLLDMAAPALAALLWQGSIPSLRIILLGLFTAFAGYSAVYALNDLVDYRIDKKKLEQGGFQSYGKDLDALLVRHPMAHGFLSFREGVIWTIGWGILALIGAYFLNPICLLIFLAGGGLEALYCLLWATSNLRTVVSGIVKSTGGMAAVFAVDPNPSLFFLLILFLWLFFWEVGGQNIPNDWADIEEDRKFKAKTVPVIFGPLWANFIISVSLALALFLNGLLLGLSPMGGGIPLILISLLIGLGFLLHPAYRLLRTKNRGGALVLFNRASYYPLALLATISLFLIFRN